MTIKLERAIECWNTAWKAVFWTVSGWPLTGATADPSTRSDMHAPPSPTSLDNAEAQDPGRGADHHRAGLRRAEFLRHRPRPARSAAALSGAGRFSAAGAAFRSARARSPAAGSTNWRGSPTSIRRCCMPRDRFGRDEDWIDYHPVLPRDGEDRVRRFPVPRHEPSRRRARHGPARCPRSPNTRCNICSCRPSSA